MCQRVPSYDPRRSERGVVATSSKRLCVGISCCVFALIAIIVTISLVASSFAKVDEGEACMQYSDYTGVLEDEVVLEPTNAFVGPSSDFHCYPKIVQEIEVRRASSPLPLPHQTPMCSPTVLRCFWRGCAVPQFKEGAKGVNRVLGTRTQEGLFISLDIHIEYRLVSEEMKELFLKFGPWENVVSNITLIARSELRNTASNYGGLEYLAGDRGLIAANMRVRGCVLVAVCLCGCVAVWLCGCGCVHACGQPTDVVAWHMYQTDLAVALQPFHLTVNEVNIRTIRLSPAFETAFDAVRQVKLAASKALQTREVDITQERRANESSVRAVLGGGSGVCCLILTFVVAGAWCR